MNVAARGCAWRPDSDGSSDYESTAWTRSTGINRNTIMRTSAALGAALGRTMDDSIEGKLKV